MRKTVRILNIILILTVAFQVRAEATFSGHDTTGLIVRQITLIGNKITRDSIVFRELTFTEGDTIDKKNLEAKILRSEQNIFNTRLFNTVDITYLEDEGDLRLFVIMNERWYVFPVPIIEVAERNFNAWWKTKDYSRLVYGVALNWSNFTGRNDLLVATLRLGYFQRMGFSYSRPFIDRSRKVGMSVNAFYSRNHETNIATLDDRQILFKQEDLYVKQDHGGGAGLSYRPGLYVTHSVEANYRKTVISDSVALLNPDYFGQSMTKQHYFSLRYLFKLNRLDITQYPTKGYWLDVEFNKTGFDFLGDDVDLLQMTARYRHFWKPSRRWSVAGSVTGKISGKSYQPFYNTRGFGYGRDYIRGYEYYVIDGQSFALFKTGIRFALLPTTILHAGVIPSSRFNTIPVTIYAGIFADAGYVDDRQFSEGNPLTNSWQYGYGAGVDVFTAYDLIFRTEYSFNRLGESGFFLHFTAPF